MIHKIEDYTDGLKGIFNHHNTNTVLESIVGYITNCYIIVSISNMIQATVNGPCSADSIQNLHIPEASFHGKYKPNKNGDMIVLVLEGSANTVGVGVLKYSPLKQR